MAVPYQVLRGPQVDTSNWLTAFRQGGADRQENEDRNLLKSVGGDMAAGNLLGAAAKAYKGGKVDTGLALTKHQHGLDLQNQETQLKLLDFFGRGGAAADTPEKREAVFKIAEGVFGANRVAPLRGVPWEQVVAGFNDEKTKLERQKLQVDLEMAREKLTGEREERGFKSNMLNRFFPSSDAPASPSYSPPSASPAMGAAPASPATEFAAAPASPTLGPTTPGMGSPSAPPAATAPQSPQDIVAKMAPTQQAMFGLLLSKGDYAGANKLLQDASETNLSAPYKDVKQKADVEEGLRKEVFATNKDYAVIRDYAKKIEDLGKNPGPAASMALIFAYMKILDPGSVVRETEYANAENARSVPEGVRQVWNKVLSGVKLTEDQVKDFLSAATTVANAQKGQYTRSMQQYQGIAKRLNVDERNVIVDLDMLKSDDALNDARDAIKRGADPAAVKQRLQDNGIDASGL